MKASGTLSMEGLALFVEVDEDFGGVALGFDGVPDGFDFAVGADEETAADNSFEEAAHEFFAAPGVVGGDHFVGGVAEQREIEFVLVAEFFQRLHGVGAGSQDGDTEPVKLRFCVTKLGRLDSSARGVGFGKEEEQDAAAFEILERELFAGVGG
jgi:hypothetical protein